jgi:hypothetical protein
MIWLILFINDYIWFILNQKKVISDYDSSLSGDYFNEKKREQKSNQARTKRELIKQ